MCRRGEHPSTTLNSGGRRLGKAHLAALPKTRIARRGRVVRCTTRLPMPAIGARLMAREDATVDALVERLDARLREWKPETAAQVRERVAEVIELADHYALDLMRPRGIEQEVLDLLDAPTLR